ncbi:MAG: SseB family protein [Rhodoglobus sp.]
MELVDNAIVRTAIAAFAAAPSQQAYLEVLRCCFQGDLLFDITPSDVPAPGDENTVTWEKGMRIGIVETTASDGERALLAFTRQDEVWPMHPVDRDAVRTLGQQAAATLEFAVEQGYGWLLLDPLGPSISLKVDDIRIALHADRNDAVKRALTPIADGDVRPAVIDALVQGGNLFYSVNKASVVNAPNVQIRTTTQPDGSTSLLAYTSPLEIHAKDLSDAVMTATVAEVVEKALSGSYVGLVINPSGPWVGLGRDELLEVQKRLLAS